MAREVDVMLVEDNPDDATLTLRSLGKAGAADKVLHVEDGAHALEVLLGANGLAKLPRFILLDLKLPKVSGLEVLRQLKANARTRRIPVVVLTSSKEERDVAESYQLGVNSYVVKPVGFEEYTAAVVDLARYWTQLNEVGDRL